MEEQSLFYEIYQEMPRQGPGCSEATLQAFSLLPQQSKILRILDIGCGSGTQTIDLARVSPAEIDALDNHRPFLDKLAKKSLPFGLSERIRPWEGSMFELPFAPATFDLIWAEGAIYIMGFQKGLTEWRQFLKPGGFIAVTELTWLESSPPKEVYDFWQGAYPGMNDIQGNLALVKEAGYRLIDHFILPEKAWWQEFYVPLAQRVQTLRRVHEGNAVAQSIYDAEEKEVNLYRRYSKTYGYVFYIMQKED